MSHLLLLLALYREPKRASGRRLIVLSGVSPFDRFPPQFALEHHRRVVVAFDRVEVGSNNSPPRMMYCTRPPDGALSCELSSQAACPNHLSRRRPRKFTSSVNFGISSLKSLLLLCLASGYNNAQPCAQCRWRVSYMRGFTILANMVLAAGSLPAQIDLAWQVAHN